MTDRARELLERVIAETDSSHFYTSEIDKEIRAYLAQPEAKREPLSSLEIVGAYRENMWEGPFNHFMAGVRFAEKHHGIGGWDE